MTVCEPHEHIHTLTHWAKEYFDVAHSLFRPKQTTTTMTAGIPYDFRCQSHFVVVWWSTVLRVDLDAEQSWFHGATAEWNVWPGHWHHLVSTASNQIWFSTVHSAHTSRTLPPSFFPDAANALFDESLHRFCFCSFASIRMRAHTRCKWLSKWHRVRVRVQQQHIDKC